MSRPRPAIGAGQTADNFLDFAHFPFLHRATIGTDESAMLHPYAVDRDGLSFKVVYEHPVANRVDPGVDAGIRPLVQMRRMTYWYTAPFFLVLRLEYLEAGSVNVIGFFIQPQSDDSCRLYMSLWCNDLGGDPVRRQAMIDFEQRVLDEDLALQTQFDDLSLPLELSAEIHTRADKNTVELRQGARRARRERHCRAELGGGRRLGVARPSLTGARASSILFHYVSR